MTPVAAYRVDDLEVCIYPSPAELAAAAAERAAAAIGQAVELRGVANAMFATGNSQLAFVAQLVATPGVPWGDVVMFHMDEYVGIDPSHPAGFARWIRQRLVEPTRPRAAHLIDALAEPTAECARYAGLLADHPLDLCCLGIGENGHLAFNDPGVARFDDPVDVKVVELDADCRRQQVGEGHFPTVDDVPARAVTVTVPALLRAATVVAVVPEARKAEPVRRALEGPVDPDCPASALRRTAGATLYLDADSAGLLGPPASH